MIQSNQAGVSEPDAVEAAVPAPEPELTTVIDGLQAGRMQATELSPDLRRRCVQHLTLSGFSASEIAQLMRMGERTVTRDRAVIRREQAVQPDENLGDELIGEFQQFTLASIQRLSRLSSDPTAPAYARLWAEEAIVRNYKRLIDTVHRLEYLETGRARLNHRKAMDPAATQQELDRMKQTIKKSQAICQLYFGTDEP